MRYIIGKCATKWSVRKQCEVNDISWLVNDTAYSMRTFSMWTFDRNYARNTNYNPGFSFDEAVDLINKWKRNEPDALFWIEEQ